MGLAPLLLRQPVARHHRQMDLSDYANSLNLQLARMCFENLKLVRMTL